MDKFAATFVEYFRYDFMRYAMIVGVLVALCASLLGVSLVLRRFSFIGDGLSHVAFGAMAVAAVLNLSSAKNSLVVLLITVLAAVLILVSGKKMKINGDASIAMISVGALAVGYLLLNLFPTSSNVSGDVCSSLFGSISILTLSKFDVLLCVTVSALVILSFVLLYNKIFAVTFDEVYAKATGTNTFIYNLIMSVMIAVVVVLAMNLVGSLLTSALIVFPALSAMRVCKTFRGVTICSAVFATVITSIGIITAAAFDLPVGSTIVIADIIGFFAFAAVGRIRK